VSYSGLGQQSSSVLEPPKDGTSSQTATTSRVQSSVQSTLPTSVQTAMPWLVPATSASQQAVPDWRRQIQRALETATLAILSLPGDLVAQLVAFFSGIAPGVRQDVEDFGRALTDPSKSDAEVAEKLGKVRDSYRSLRPSLPGPVVRALDPIVEGAIGLVPATVTIPSVQTPSVVVPWLWVAGSFVAGMAACSFFSESKVKANRRRRVRRNRRRR
jgi:hypothetical protein